MIHNKVIRLKAKEEDIIEEVKYIRGQSKGQGPEWITWISQGNNRRRVKREFS